MVSRLEFADRFGFLPIIGMVHLTGSDKVKRALEEIETYQAEGFSGVIVENYSGSVQEVAETLYTMKNLSKKKFSIPLGVNILPNNFSMAFMLSNVAGGSFIQLDYVAGEYVRGGKTTSGNFARSISLNEKTYFELRARNPDIAVIGGVWPKYYQPIPSSNLEADLLLGSQRADAIAVTGEGTGKETPLEKIVEYRRLLPEDKPLIVAAGLNISNIHAQLSVADGGIVGSYCKKNGIDMNELDIKRVRDFMKEVKLTREYLIKSGQI